MIYHSDKTVHAQVTAVTTARANNKKTDSNISKLKTYMSKDESKNRSIFK